MRFSHGMSQTPTYASWASMLDRCTNPKASNFSRYGARGITVCDRWRTFSNFYADMGERPAGMTLDRIDNDGPYEPGNCRWSTQREQSHNRRSSVILTAFGESKVLALWEADPRCQVKPGTLQKRIRNGWPPETALSQPVNEALSHPKVPNVRVAA